MPSLYQTGVIEGDFRASASPLGTHWEGCFCSAGAWKLDHSLLQLLQVIIEKLQKLRALSYCTCQCCHHRKWAQYTAVIQSCMLDVNKPIRFKFPTFLCMARRAVHSAQTYFFPSTLSHKPPEIKKSVAATVHRHTHCLLLCIATIFLTSCKYMYMESVWRSITLSRILHSLSTFVWILHIYHRLRRQSYHQYRSLCCLSHHSITRYIRSKGGGLVKVSLSCLTQWMGVVRSLDWMSGCGLDHEDGCLNETTLTSQPIMSVWLQTSFPVISCTSRLGKMRRSPTGRHTWLFLMFVLCSAPGGQLVSFWLLSPYRASIIFQRLLTESLNESLWLESHMYSQVNRSRVEGYGLKMTLNCCGWEGVNV